METYEVPFPLFSLAGFYTRRRSRFCIFCPSKKGTAAKAPFPPPGSLSVELAGDSFFFPTGISDEMRRHFFFRGVVFFNFQVCGKRMHPEGDGQEVPPFFLFSLSFLAAGSLALLVPGLPSQGPKKGRKKTAGALFFFSFFIFARIARFGTVAPGSMDRGAKKKRGGFFFFFFFPPRGPDQFAALLTFLWLYDRDEEEDRLRYPVPFSFFPFPPGTRRSTRFILFFFFFERSSRRFDWSRDLFSFFSSHPLHRFSTRA